MKFKMKEGYLIYQILTFFISLISYVLAVQSGDSIQSLIIYFFPFPLEILEALTFEFNIEDNKGYNYDKKIKKLEWTFFKLNIVFLCISIVFIVLLLFKLFNIEIIKLNDQIYTYLPVLYLAKQVVELITTMTYIYKKRKKMYMSYL